MWSVNAPSKSNNGCAHKKVRRAEDKERGAGGGWVGLKTKKKKNMLGESSGFTPNPNRHDFLVKLTNKQAVGLVAPLSPFCRRGPGIRPANHGQNWGKQGVRRRQCALHAASRPGDQSSFLHAALVDQYPAVEGLCGVCNDCKESGDRKGEPGPASPTITVHAVEPLPTNVPLLRKLQLRAKAAKRVTMFVHPGAVGPSAEAPLFFNASTCLQVGRESCRLNTKDGPYMQAVTTWSLTSFVAEHRLDHIDFLMIDTEGYDGATLLNSVDFLKARIARMIEFEYHAIGRWGPSSGKVQLKQVVDTMDAAGYSCYLQGKDRKLVDLTGTCWSPAYEMYTWTRRGVDW